MINPKNHLQKQASRKKVNSSKSILRGILTTSKSNIVDITSQQIDDQSLIQISRKDIDEFEHTITDLKQQINKKDRLIADKNKQIQSLRRGGKSQDYHPFQKQNVVKATSLLEENEFLTKNNRSFYKTTVKLTEENYKLNEQLEIKSKEISSLEERIREVKMTERELMEEKKSIIQENQRDIRKLEHIKQKFEIQKAQLIDHIRFLQKVPKRSECRTGISTSRGLSEIENYENKKLKSQIEAIKYSISELEQDQRGTKKKKRGVSCV